MRALWRGAGLRVAADGGARNARQRLGLAPQVVVGDLDSLDEQTRAWCEQSAAEMVRHPRAKIETDLELALDLALARGATEVIILGAQGGRFDHMLANVLLLVKAGRARVHTRIAGDGFDAFIVWEHISLRGSTGDIVSLIPLAAQADGIITQGLQYPLRHETLFLGSPRGVSNVMTAARAEVTLTGGLLLVVHVNVHTHSILEDEDARS